MRGKREHDVISQGRGERIEEIEMCGKVKRRKAGIAKGIEGRMKEKLIQLNVRRGKLCE